MGISIHPAFDNGLKPAKEGFVGGHVKVHVPREPGRGDSNTLVHGRFSRKRTNRDRAPIVGS